MADSGSRPRPLWTPDRRQFLRVMGIAGRPSCPSPWRRGRTSCQYIAPLSQFEPSVNDMKDVTDEAVKRWGQQLELCKQSSFNPATGRYYAYSPGWVPDPGDYRTSLWTAVGMPKGPSTWDELLEGGAEIKKTKNTQLGIGMSQEIDSNMAGRALMWSYGASVQDENERVVINSPETVAAVEFMTKLFKQSMTDEVFSCCRGWS
jgi:ABC-type glycerol-3-phosphate transport system substrate-binding protein